MKFVGYEVSGIRIGARPSTVRVVDLFQLRDAAIECARLLQASGQWRDVTCTSLSIDGESVTTYPVLFQEEMQA